MNESYLTAIILQINSSHTTAGLTFVHHGTWLQEVPFDNRFVVYPSVIDMTINNYGNYQLPDPNSLYSNAFYQQVFWATRAQPFEPIAEPSPYWKAVSPSTHTQPFETFDSCHTANDFRARQSYDGNEDQQYHEYALYQSSQEASCAMPGIVPLDHEKDERTESIQPCSTNQEKLYRCGECSKTFQCRRYLKKHQIRTHSVKLFQCAICLRDYAYRWELRQHQAMHTEGDPHRCDNCSKEYKRKSGLRRHKSKCMPGV